MLNEARAPPAIDDKPATIIGGEPGMMPSNTGCPNCKQQMPPDAVICVGCGYDRRLGRKVATVGNIIPASAQSEMKLDLTPEEDSGIPFWKVFVAVCIVAVVGFVGYQGFRLIKPADYKVVGETVTSMRAQSPGSTSGAASAGARRS